MTSEVWIGEEHHGYQFAFSTREKAEDWFEREVKSQGGYDIIEEGRVAIEENSDEKHHALYWDGEVVAKIERYEVDVA